MPNDIAKSFFENNRILKGHLLYARRPDPEDIERLKESLKDIYDATEVILEEEEAPEIIGGYILQVGDRIYDNSIKSSFDRLAHAMKHEIQKGDGIDLKPSAIDGFEDRFTMEEGGQILRLHDGIAAVDGITKAVYGEIVLFENGVKGLVQNIDEFETLVVVMGDTSGLEEGMKLIRTNKQAAVPVGDRVLGRVLNALGAPIDGEGDIQSDQYYVIEKKAPGVLERQPVNTPMETGILAIDAMFPIGRGQRELIIGDRQTGKTSICLDTIANQKGKDVICVYVAIGQKASTVAQVVRELKEKGAMDYTCVVAATASDSAAMQYMAPYSGCAIAEYFMDQGKDVLIVYDDLSKHAIAYRALSLLMGRSPGREAYPGDVFYLHSRLLERAGHMNEGHGNGSITALPIVETQAGDISAYIPTNIISITDGQLFLESDLFFAGVRPALNVGLSVSRVGGAAQTKAMKKASKALRIDLAQYKEIESFSRFTSELDNETKKQIAYGKGLTELLKQPLYAHKSMAEQVVTLIAAKTQKMIDLPVEDLPKIMADFYQDLNLSHHEVISSIENTGDLSDDVVKTIEDHLTKYLEARHG